MLHYYYLLIMTDFQVNNNNGCGDNDCDTGYDKSYDKSYNYDSNSSMAIYIPYVHARHCYLKYIRDIFHELGIGWVARIRSPSMKSNNKQSVIVYMQEWYNNSFSWKIWNMLSGDFSRGFKLFFDNTRFDISEYWLLTRSYNSQLLPSVPDKMVVRLDKIEGDYARLQSYNYKLNLKNMELSKRIRAIESGFSSMKADMRSGADVDSNSSTDTNQDNHDFLYQNTLEQMESFCKAMNDTVPLSSECSNDRNSNDSNNSNSNDSNSNDSNSNDSNSNDSNSNNSNSNYDIWNSSGIDLDYRKSFGYCEVGKDIHV